jgi:DNA-binding SARP family transcriptional activator
VTIALNLLDDVRWRGRTVVGDRPRALLAALAARGCRPVPAEDLIELVWGDEAPLNGMKSLQVLVSRARTACGAEAIVRDGAGYRLGAVPNEVDSARLAALVRAAASALDQDAAAAVAHATEALELAAGLPEIREGEAGPLAEVRRAGVKQDGSPRGRVSRARGGTRGAAARRTAARRPAAQRGRGERPVGGA